MLELRSSEQGLCSRGRLFEYGMQCHHQQIRQEAQQPRFSHMRNAKRCYRHHKRQQEEIYSVLFVFLGHYAAAHRNRSRHHKGQQEGETAVAEHCAHKHHDNCKTYILEEVVDDIERKTFLELVYVLWSADVPQTKKSTPPIFGLLLEGRRRRHVAIRLVHTTKWKLGCCSNLLVYRFTLDSRHNRKGEKTKVKG